MEVPPAQSGLITEDIDTTLSLNSLNSIHGSVSGKEVIYCEHCAGWKEVDATENMNVESSLQIAPLHPEEPSFTCPVCISELTDPCSTICGHIFCLDCILLSIKKFKKCPICCKKLTMRKFHRVYLPCWR